MIKAYLVGKIISTNEAKARNLSKTSSFGELIEEKIHYSLSEAFYLFEKKKIVVYFKDKKLTKKELESKLEKLDKKFSLKYPVFKDLRSKSYVVKTALKFGADFRVYPKGKKAGTAHSKWLVFCEHETNKIAWQDFSAKNRVAHSTKKNLLIAVLDEEASVSYYEIKWIKP